MIQDLKNNGLSIVYWVAYNSDDSYANHGELNTNEVLSYAYDHLQDFSDYEAYKTELAIFNITI